MANQYFQHGTPLTRHTLARAEMLNGIFQSIEAGFDRLASPDQLREGLSRFLEDTGAVNAYEVAFDPASTTYTRGMNFLMGAANTNTGAATINVNGMGVQPILRADGSAIEAGDIQAGMAIWLVYDGANFRMVGATGGSGGGTQGPPGEPGEDGAPGTPGLSVAELTIYRRSATPLTVAPTGGQFNFTTRTLTPPVGWSAGIPAGAGDAYASVAFAAIEGNTGIDASITWSAPVRALSDGASTDVVFQRSASQPATPAPSAGVPAGWYTNVADVPAGAERMWAMFGTRPDAASNWTWQAPLPVEGEQGEQGEQGPPGDPGTPGGNSILGLLSNETHSVAAASSGGGYDLTGAGGTFFVWDGITAVTGAGPVYSVVGDATKNGLTISINAGTGVYALAGAGDSWTTDQEQFTLRAVYGGVTVDRIYTISKSRAGQDGEGASAYLLSVTASAQAFKYNGAGQLVSPTQIDFTALQQNTLAPVSWKTQRWNGTAWVDTATNRMTPTSGVVSALTEAAFALENTDALRVVASMTEGGTPYTDAITVVKLADGAQGPPGTDGADGADGQNAILGLLSNEAHVVPANADGTGYSLVGAGGTFRVWNGATQVTGAGPVYSVVAPATVNGLTMAINAASGVYALSGAAWSGNLASFTLRATYQGVVIDRVYTISKASAGIGTKGLRISASGQVFRYNGLGALIEPSGLLFTAQRENSSAAVSWKTQRWNGSAWVDTATNRMSPTTGLESALTAASFAAEAVTSLRIVAAMTDGGTYTDAITVMRVQDGDDGEDGESVNIIFRRSASQLAAPGASAGVPVGWYDTTGEVPAGADPLWASVGTRPDSASNWTWQTPFQVEGQDGPPGDPGSPGLSVVQLVVYRRSASAPSNPSGGSFNFGARVLTPPSGWALSPPAGTDPVYMARGTATIAGQSGTATPAWSAAELAAGNWTPITLEDFAAGLEPVVIHSGGTPASVYLGGDLVFYTTDGKLYRWAGSSYTKDMSASDIAAGTVSAAITMASNFILTTAGRLYTNGKTSAFSSTPGVFLGHDGISNYDFAIGNATKFVRWDGSAGSLEIAGQVISDGLVSNTIMEPSSFRIRAPGTVNTCPPVIEDYGISAHPSGAQSLAARSVTLTGFTAPNYNTGADYHFKRFAYHKMDVILESEVVTHSINNYTLTWQYSTNNGVSWSTIKTHTYNGNNTRAQQNSKFRFTTPTSWSTLQFRLLFPSAHCSYMQLTARIANWAESAYPALSSSSLTDYVPPDPPPLPPGWIEP